MKILKEKLSFVFLIMFMFLCLSVCGVFGISSFAMSVNEIATNSVTASFTFNGSTQSDNPSFTQNYTATEYSLSVSGVENVTAYEWYFATDSDYSKINDATTSAISIRNCNQSGNYVCKLTTNDGVKVTQPVSITINPVVVTFTKFTAKNKEYDGTTKIEIVSEYSGILAGDSDVEVTVIGNTSTPNAETKRYVTITTNDITFSSPNGSNYIANESLPTDIVLVDIAKKPVTFIWETKDNKEAYDYNGTDQIGNISVYYYGLNNIKTPLAFTISGYNGSSNFYNEFKNAGNYTATATVTSREINFDITNLTKRFDIKKVNPVVTINNEPFVYNGNEQDAKDRVTINNSEQTLNFTNNKFTTVLEGNGKEVTVYANESMNFLGFTRKFKMSVIKGTATLDVSNINKNFTYTGSRQIINSGATINNIEQTISYSNNSFTTVLEGNNLEVGVFANATANYNYVSTSFVISVDKATLDTSYWRWNYVSPYIYSVGTERVLRVDYYPKDIVNAVYKNERATNVGVYEASVTFNLIDRDNYNEVPAFPNIVWRINKQTVTIPVLDNETTVYNGKSQTLSNLSSNLLYTVKGNEQTNAGTYPVTISLTEPNNFEWDNGTSNDLVINWTIQKAEVAKPNFNLDDFDGTPQSIGIREDAPYELIYSDDKFILLGLKDGNNYTWQDSVRPYLRIDRPAGFFDGPALPIFVITLTLLTLILIAVYFAVHSTIIIKRHHKKVALLKARKLKKQIVPVTSSNLPENTNFTIENELEEPARKIDLENKDNSLKANKEEPLEKEEKVKKEEIVSKEPKADSLEEPKGELQDENLNTKTVKPRAKRKSLAKVVEGEKTRKPYAKSRKIENKKKVAQKKKEINAKKVAVKKEAEKKKKAKQSAKKKVASTKTSAKPKTASKTSQAKKVATKPTTKKATSTKKV